MSFNPGFHLQPDHEGGEQDQEGQHQHPQVERKKCFSNSVCKVRRNFPNSVAYLCSLWVDSADSVRVFYDMLIGKLTLKCSFSIPDPH
jgi:hypothetical protein